MVWNNKGVIITDPEQLVLLADPYTKLSYTWHSFTPEMLEMMNVDNEAAATLAREQRSRVTFDLEQLGEKVKLTVVHDHFEQGSLAATMVRNGWPSILSSLKTLLETGEPLG
jgi:uncharacterized protein YndB with AHSA1/START domain